MNNSNDNNDLKIKVASSQNIGSRDSQEDSYGYSNINDTNFIKHGGVLAIVADGMGGYENGGWSSVNAVKNFTTSYNNKAPTESILDSLKKAANDANSVVFKEAKKLNYLNKMGSTLVAVVVANDQLFWVNIGDSRIYLYHEDILHRISSDHSYSNVLQKSVDKGEISQEEADKHPMRNGLTSFLGRENPEMQLEHYSSPLMNGDWLVLCSDGLSGVLSNNEISMELYGEPQEASDRLIKKVLNKQIKHQDNVTVSLIKIGEHESPICTINNTDKTVPIYPIEDSLGSNDGTLDKNKASSDLTYLKHKASRKKVLLILMGTIFLLLVLLQVKSCLRAEDSSNEATVNVQNVPNTEVLEQADVAVEGANSATDFKAPIVSQLIANNPISDKSSDRLNTEAEAKKKAEAEAKKKVEQAEAKKKAIEVEGEKAKEAAESETKIDTEVNTTPSIAEAEANKKAIEVEGEKAKEAAESGAKIDTEVNTTPSIEDKAKPLIPK